jgi:hypothetical protein
VASHRRSVGHSLNPKLMEVGWFLYISPFREMLVRSAVIFFVLLLWHCRPPALRAPRGDGPTSSGFPWRSIAESSGMPALTRPQKITFRETRASGVRGVLVYCADHKCSTRSK